MRYLSRIMELDWLGSSRLEPTDKDEKKDTDVNIAKLDDDGGIYLISLDWAEPAVYEWLENGDFLQEWERQMSNTGLCILSGKMSKDGDVEIVHTSLDEIFEHKDGG